jgi:hypothetical protein
MLGMNQPATWAFHMVAQTARMGILFCVAGVAAAQQPFALVSFETGQAGNVILRGDPGTKIVEDRDKATDGASCLRVEAGGKDTYNGFEITDKNLLRPFKDYLLLKLDVHNPQSDPIVFGITMADTRSTSWGMKHNGSATAAPGRSMIEVNLTGLNA